MASKRKSKLSQSRPTSASLSSLDLSVTKCISKLTQSRPPGASLSSLDLSVSKCISKLAQSRPPSGSLSSLDLSLQVHLQTRSITASKYILKERWQLSGDTGVTEVDRVTGSIYSADPGVDRHHLISISSYHTMKIHTLSFPTFRLTRSVRDFLGPRNRVDPQRRVVSYLLTRFLRSSNQNRCFLSIPFGCRERCGGMLMVGFSAFWLQVVHL
jgi:hypothetical protein